MTHHQHRYPHGVYLKVWPHHDLAKLVVEQQDPPEGKLVRLRMPLSQTSQEGRLNDVLQLHLSKQLHDIVIRSPPRFPHSSNKHLHLTKSDSNHLLDRHMNHPASDNPIR
ncbi:unnamed protein product [Lactuca saligna]|uniref:Uncharacterized protein n=1 Tax=Lactuca saligna TaxID=75948 RepID=A0AA35ZV51_LACSI|nr:unnamed protein product [Lactuca saligna]